MFSSDQRLNSPVSFGEALGTRDGQPLELNSPEYARRGAPQAPLREGERAGRYRLDSDRPLVRQEVLTYPPGQRAGAGDRLCRPTAFSQ